MAWLESDRRSGAVQLHSGRARGGSTRRRQRLRRRVQDAGNPHEDQRPAGGVGKRRCDRQPDGMADQLDRSRGRQRKRDPLAQLDHELEPVLDQPSVPDRRRHGRLRGPVPRQQPVRRGPGFGAGPRDARADDVPPAHRHQHRKRRRHVQADLDVERPVDAGLDHLLQGCRRDRRLRAGDRHAADRHRRGRLSRHGNDRRGSLLQHVRGGPDPGSAAATTSSPRSPRRIRTCAAAARWSSRPRPMSRPRRRPIWRSRRPTGSRAPFRERASRTRSR